jgi:hypothetical protein
VRPHAFYTSFALSSTHAENTVLESKQATKLKSIGKENASQARRLLQTPLLQSSAGETRDTGGCMCKESLLPFAAERRTMQEDIALIENLAGIKRRTQVLIVLNGRRAVACQIQLD